MLSKESVSVRPNWETRISNKGLSPDHWSEGSMVVMRGSPADLVDSLMSYASRVPMALNDLFAEGDFSKAPELGTLFKEKVFNAAASSWAHQDPSFPVRFDIAVTKQGKFSLLGVKGDYLEGMIAAAATCKAWHQHHFEGMSDMLEVNYLKEHLIRELQPFGSHASPPSIYDVTIFSSENVCSSYMASCIGDGSGLKLSKMGIGKLEDIDKQEIGPETPHTKSVIKIDPWSEILKDADDTSPWFNLFSTPRAFTFQPPWVLALDEMVDFAEDVEEDQIDMVLNIWLSINSQSPVPLIVSSQYKPGYRFEDSIITPVVLNPEMDGAVEEPEATPE